MLIADRLERRYDTEGGLQPEPYLLPNPHRSFDLDLDLVTQLDLESVKSGFRKAAARCNLSFLQEF